MDIEELTTINVSNYETFFRKPRYPIKAKSQFLELERLIFCLTGEKFEDYDGKYMRRLINPHQFEFLKVYDDTYNHTHEDSYADKYSGRFICLCSENTCNHLIITRYIPTDICFAVGSVCINRFNEENSKVLYNLKDAKKCDECKVPLVYKENNKFIKNTNKSCDGMCFLCWNENKRIYLNVPFSKKDEAKSKGARWNPELKCWYIFTQNTNRKALIKIYGLKDIE